MSHSAIRGYLNVAGRNSPAGPTDTELLARFASTHDETAFELLVWRHAALVQRVCRAVLGDHHAAEDAAQAAFLILARKAHTFTGNQSVIGWLYTVSRRVALRLARQRTRGGVTSSSLDAIPALPHESAASPYEVEALCAEVDRLPERYRVPVLLCFFDGLTHAEAARRTGWAIGTVAGRLARAKELLARRLSRKGLGVATVVLGLPAGNFVGGTARAAIAFANRVAVVPGVDPNVFHLAQGALNAMTVTKLKLAAASALSCVVLATGWALAMTGTTFQQAQPEPTDTFLTQVITNTQQASSTQQALPDERVATRNNQLLSVNALKQVILAIHNYHDAYNVLPNNIVDKNGKPLLSWRVQILPFLEQAQLYNEFKLGEPWDSEHNKKLLDKMPDLYRLPFQKKDVTKTYFQVFAGPGTAFEPGKKLTVADITDGTSNTLGAVIAGPPVEWSKPDDIAYDPTKPLPKLDLPYKNIFVAATMDGAVHTLKPNLDPKLLKLLIERADGQVIPALNKDFEVQLPIAKEEINSLRGALKEEQRLLTALSEQVKEHEKLLEEFIKLPNVGDVHLEDGYKHLPNHNQLSEAVDALKEKNEELKKLIEAKGKK